ncbi:MAG: capsular biosynthesis protein, partial [Bacteroidales bacterium]|nr:capsular biosynthesis protein [Bacteroidales bacterium]
MWPFTKHITIESSHFFEGFVDCHSHILPGVDDGVRHIDESLEILERYEEMGLRGVWFTPHIMEDIPNTPSDLRERFEALKSSYHGRLE